MNKYEILGAIENRSWSKTMLYNDGDSCAVGSVLLECGIPPEAINGRGHYIHGDSIQDREFNNKEEVLSYREYNEYGNGVGLIRVQDALPVLTDYGNPYFWSAVMDINDTSSSKEEALNRIEEFMNECYGETNHA